MEKIFMQGMTEKLYESDSYLKEFDACVLSCEPRGDRWRIVLDRTAFFPEGGGQPCDIGRLGSAMVVDVQIEDDRICHICTGEIAPGTEVHGEIDWKRRFDLMQQHSGEHIVSGLLHARYGCDNVGFHLGAELIEIDFDHQIPREDIPTIEAEVNRAIWEDIPVALRYPTPEQLADIPYRSKKALEGQVRIVEIPGVDTCACCGTHVQRTGEIGLVKIVSSMKLREGSRLEILCGERAFLYLSRIFDQNKAISGLLSAKPMETAGAVENLKQENADLKYRITGMENSEFSRIAEDLRDKGDVLVFRESMTSDNLRRLANEIRMTCGGRCAVFSGTDEAGYQYALAEKDGDVRELAEFLNQVLHGKGGGKPGFIQGSLKATRSEIHGFFQLMA